MGYAKRNVVLHSAYFAYDHKEYIRCLKIVHSLLKKSNNPKDLLSALYFLEGDAYFELDHYSEAVQSYQKALRLNPHPEKNNTIYFKLGLVYYRLTLYDKAMLSFNRAIKLQNVHPNYYFNLGLSLIKLNDIPAGIECFRKMIALDPDNTKAYRNIGLYSEYSNLASYLENADYKNIHRILLNPNLSKTKKIDCHFALAKILFDAKEYDLAFEQYRKGNNLRSLHHPYDPSGQQEKIKKIIQIFTKSYFDHLKSLPYTGNPTTKPIFIIGLPRSGKTLVEKLISQSSIVYPKEELAVLNRKIYHTIGSPNSAHYKDRFQSLSALELDEIAEHYLKKLEANVSDDILKITDTTPCNFEFVGWIKTLFPKAKIIFCNRNPLDHCVQLYFKNFTEGHQYTNSLESIAQDYIAYRTVIHHWKTLFRDTILEIHYENLVENPNEIQKNIFEYLEIELNTIPESAPTLIISKKELGFAQHFDKYLDNLKRDLIE